MERQIIVTTQEILLGAKAECLRLFTALLQGAVKDGAEKLFASAYKTTNFAEHHLFLDCYSALTSRESLLVRKMESGLRELLDRSIQTAYSTTRPEGSTTASTGGWTLVDANAIDDEIRLQKVTALFHAKSGHEIRDLNLRIAALFEQALVRERENPFRPYLFSRCIHNTVSELKVSPEVSAVVADRLVGELLDGVTSIYRALNGYFEDRDIVARLPSIAKASEIRAPGRRVAGKLPRGRGEAQTGPAAIPVGAGPADAANASHSPSHLPSYSEMREAGQGASLGNPASGSTRNSGDAADPRRPAHKLEQLLQMVRKKAASPGGADTSPGNAAAVHSGNGAQSDARNIAADMGGLEDDTHRIGDAVPVGAFSGLASAAEWLSGGHVVGTALQQFLSHGTAHGSDRESAALRSGSVEANEEWSRRRSSGAVYQLLRHRPAATVDDVVSGDGEIRNLILEDRFSLVSKAADNDEMMTIDVVGMIFEFILRDTQVPAEIRAQLGRMQFLILKLALVDRELLTQTSHPARVLINRIGTVAIGLKANDPAGARITAEIHRIVETLLQEETDGAPPFERMVDEFETFLARDLRSSTENVERAVEAVEAAEKRSAYFSRLAAALAAAFCSVQTDPYLKTFIEGVWLRAIEKAEFSDPEVALRYRKLIPELIWSILEKRSERERARLLAHLPQMLFDLKAGLNAVKYVEKQGFLSWLIDSHTRAIKAVGSSGEYYSLTGFRQKFERFVAVSAAGQPESDTVRIDREFINDAAEELDVQLDQIDTLLEFGSGGGTDANAAQTGGVEPDADVHSESDEVLKRLRVGVPVEINIDGAPRRAMLNWMSAGATNMILSLEGNDFPTTISVSLFRKLLANDRARLMEVEPLFERAVSALLETADKVDQIFE